MQSACRSGTGSGGDARLPLDDHVMRSRFSLCIAAERVAVGGIAGDVCKTAETERGDTRPGLGLRSIDLVCTRFFRSPIAKLVEDSYHCASWFSQFGKAEL